MEQLVRVKEVFDNGTADVLLPMLGLQLPVSDTNRCSVSH